MPLDLYIANPQEVHDLAERFNHLESRLAVTNEPGMKAQLMADMEEIRRRYNNLGGSAALDPSKSPDDAPPAGYRLLPGGRLMKI